MMNTINKGNIYSLKDNYIIYEIDDTSKYYLCIPNHDTYKYTMYMGLSMNNFNKIDKENKITEIDSIASKLYKINPNSVYLLPVVNHDKLINAVYDNDDYFYNKLLNDLHKCIKDAYDTIRTNNTVSINSVIYAVKQNNKVDYFLDWLDVKLGGYLDTININKINELYNEINLEKTQVIKIADIPVNKEEDIKKEDTPKVENIPTKKEDTHKVENIPNVKEEIPIVKEENAKKKVLKKVNKEGFSDYKFIVLTIIISVIIGVTSAIISILISKGQ